MSRFQTQFSTTELVIFLLPDGNCIWSRTLCALSKSSDSNAVTASLSAAEPDQHLAMYRMCCECAQHCTHQRLSLVDTDNASSTTPRDWWAYMQVQPEIGIPAYYFVPPN